MAGETDTQLVRTASAEAQGAAALDAEAAGAWVARFVDAFAAREGELTALDREAGDGDFGVNVRAALERVRPRLSEPHGSSREVLDVVSRSFLRMGGTSGPLFGMWFRELASALDGAAPVAAQLAAGARAAVDAVMRLGGAQVGDKTMVDAMAPAADALAAAAAEGVGAAAALVRAADAARAGAEATRGMAARRGRASYVGAVAVGVVDPGALTVALFFSCGAEAA